MAHTEPGTTQRLLNREVAGVIALLADEEDFSAMRRYRSFVFHDHRAYLRQIEALLRSRTSAGRHTTLALFDPEEYAEFCTGTGLDPDTPASRTRFTAELAATGTTLAYDGRPLAQLLPDLVAAALRDATWAHASALLAGTGHCTGCGADLGWAAFTRACDLVLRVLDRAGPGTHHLVCSAATSADTLLSVLDAARDDQGRGRVDDRDLRAFATVLAVGFAVRSAGGLVVRTTDPGTRDRVYGWRLEGWYLRPLTAAEVFDAYCTDVRSGDLIAPEPGVDYVPPPDLGPDHPAADHAH